MAVVKKIKTVFQFRRGTTEEWQLNKDIIPAAGEPCFDLDLGTLKIGDGKTTYENLKVLGGATISDDMLYLELQEDIEILQALVGTTSVADQIADAMEGVATADELETVINNMTTLESKVTTSNESVTEMQTIIEQKADATTVIELQTIVDQKADTTTVQELQTVVESKVDNSALEALETDMKTYVDEQIQLIEVESMDGGVIE